MARLVCVSVSGRGQMFDRDFPGSTSQQLEIPCQQTLAVRSCTGTPSQNPAKGIRHRGRDAKDLVPKLTLLASGLEVSSWIP